MVNIWKRLQEHIFAYQKRHMLKKPARWMEWKQVRNILLLFESDYIERNDEIKKLRDALLLEDKDVTLWGYVEKKEIMTLILPQSRILGLNDYNLLGKPREYVLNDLKAEHYDLLIDLTTRPLLPLRYLAMYTDASFKVGLNLGEGLHDMLLSLPDLDTENAKPEASWLYNQIMNYLTSIRSMD